MKKFLLVLAALSIGAIYLMSGEGGMTGNVVATVSALEIPLAEISETASYYEYDVGGTTVRFFAIKASDGSVRTAFDACDVCFDRKKGYRQEGNMMVCNNCGNKYPIDGLGTENKRGGGCWPGYLPSKIVGDKLMIEGKDLKSGEYRFK
jgi:uncharacterized membrane protein